MKTIHHRLLLADDDMDDCIFFREALDELPVQFTLSMVHDGVELMQLLNSKDFILPDMLFLDLNMPKKTGFDCLPEIKSNQKLKDLPVIVISTSFDHLMVDRLYKNGAHYFIRKPAEFSKLKSFIQEAILITIAAGKKQTPREKFVLNNS